MRNNILTNIAQIRKSKGFSQEYIAAKIGMGQSGYGHIENGQRGLQYDVLLQIANALEMDVIDIILYPDKIVVNSNSGEGSQINVENNSGKVFSMHNQSSYTELSGAMLKKVLERDNAVQGKDKIINTLLEQNKDIAIINEQLKVKDLQIANMQKHIDKLTDKLCN